jgi:prevent-host-death family protein
MAHVQRIGVRELRQNASRYLGLVEKGERFEITDRGRPVALLVPISGSAWRDLVASGRMIPPEEEGDITDLEPLDLGVSASKVLEGLREHER